MCCDKQGNIVDYREYLKVKVKSLAEEARIIRKEEARGSLREGLHRHRVDIVRPEARAAHLAYGLIKGRTLKRIEPTAREPRAEGLWKRVRAMVDKYGPVDPARRGELLEGCKD
jgi:hypothetical protein